MKKSGNDLILAGKSLRIFCLVLLIVLFGLVSFGCGSSAPVDAWDPEPSPLAEPTLEQKSPLENESTPEDGTEGGQEASSVQGEGKDQKPYQDQEPADVDSPKQGQAIMLSINCSTVFDNLNKIDQAIVETLPGDGWIYPAKELELKEGESVFDILLRVAKKEKIHMEFNSNPALKSKYVEGISNLYEFDAGELSGWTYKINGKGMGHGSSSSFPKDGDTIEWIYTCDQGRDVGVVAE